MAYVIQTPATNEGRPDPRAHGVFERAARAVVLHVRLERDGTQDGLPKSPRLLVEPLPQPNGLTPGPPVSSFKRLLS